jgi:hypothetical protein
LKSHVLSVSFKLVRFMQKMHIDITQFPFASQEPLTCHLAWRSESEPWVKDSQTCLEPSRKCPERSRE